MTLSSRTRRRAIAASVVVALLCSATWLIWTIVPATERTIIRQARALSPELDQVIKRYPNAHVHVSYLWNPSHDQHIGCDFALFDRYIVSMEIRHKTNVFRSRIVGIQDVTVFLQEVTALSSSSPNGPTVINFGGISRASSLDELRAFLRSPGNVFAGQHLSEVPMVGFREYWQRSQ